MKTGSPARATRRAALTNRTFVVHYLQMLAAMGVGMVVLEPLSMHVVHHAGAELEVLLMATTMVAGMTAWMVYRRHPWPGIAEMIAAMYVAVTVPFPLYWIGALDPVGLTILGHVLMLPAVAVAMLRRRGRAGVARRRGVDPGG
jgi:flagellar biosynthetic protein FliP